MYVTDSHTCGRRQANAHVNSKTLSSSLYVDVSIEGLGVRSMTRPCARVVLNSSSTIT